MKILRSLFKYKIFIVAFPNMSGWRSTGNEQISIRKSAEELRHFSWGWREEGAC